MAKVKVSQGWLEGEVLEMVTGDGQYYSFKGIPYAAPPVGTLRFKAPQPPLPWEGVRKATAHGAECTQHDILSNQFVPGSEDCLFLNVYTQTLTPKTPLPVMVFIHGGGCKSGSGNENKYGADFLVNHGVILVTINYRLEALGFLCLDTEDVPGNAGMKDQVAAFRWVKENISNFGGDPDNVTIFGESAGGAATIFHVLSPMTKGLFKRAISMSGVPTNDWILAYKPRQRAFLLGKQLGIETEDPKELLEYLQSLPAEKLTNTNPALLASEELSNQNIIKLYYFTPVIEKVFGGDQFLTETPFDILKQGKINDVDLFIGHTSEESLIAGDGILDYFAKSYDKYPEMVVPREILLQSAPDTILEISKKIHQYYFDKKPIGKDTVQRFARYLSDACFVYDIHRFVRRLPKGNGKRFFYLFSSMSERNFYGNKGKQYGIHGAAHLDDLLYLFDAKSLNMNVDNKSREYKLIQLVCKVFTNFAKYGNPTPDNSLGVTWPEFDIVNKQFVDIGDQLVIDADYRPDMVAFWEEVFKTAGVEF